MKILSSKRLLISLFVALLAIGLLSIILWLENLLHQPLRVPETNHRVEVIPGQGLNAILAQLESEGVLSHGHTASRWIRIKGREVLPQQGEYLLKAPLTLDELLDLLQAGKVIQYPITIPEGVTLAWTIDLLGAQSILEPILEGVDDHHLREMSSEGGILEGWFLPDTYFVNRGDTDLSVLRRANRALMDVLDNVWRTRDPDLPFKTKLEALTLASIVERETGQALERPIIAGVFLNRLKRDMKLQTDPTVIYGIGPEFDGNLRRSHLEDEGNPYNTYAHKGLPPSPIALPGRAAIDAVFAPEDTDALFFVAKGDGSHVFSRTLKEHQLNVQSYQIKRVPDYRSSPR